MTLSELIKRANQVNFQVSTAAVPLKCNGEDFDIDFKIVSDDCVISHIEVKQDLASAWTEEDEHTRANLSSLLFNLRAGKKIEMATFEKYYNWLKTIHVKPRKPSKSFALTWEDMKKIIEISDSLLEYAEAGIIEPFLATEESYYSEILKRFNEQRKK